MPLLAHVNSRQIKAIGYVASGNELFVEFNTKTKRSVYRYTNVPALVAAELFFAESIGTTFNKGIKAEPGVYPFERVSECRLPDFEIVQPEQAPFVEDFRALVYAPAATDLDGSLAEQREKN